MVVVARLVEVVAVADVGHHQDLRLPVVVVDETDFAVDFYHLFYLVYCLRHYLRPQIFREDLEIFYLYLAAIYHLLAMAAVDLAEVGL